MSNVAICTLCSERWQKMPCKSCGDVSEVWMLIQVVPGLWDTLCGGCSDLILAASADSLRKRLEELTSGAE
jgi:hypothetical protein